MKVRLFHISNWKLPIIALCGLTFALVSVLGRESTPAKEPSVIPPKSSFTNTVAGIGVIEPKSELISLGVELPGVVRDIHVKVGNSVKKGDILFTLDQRDIDAQIAVLEQSLAASIIQAQDASAQFEIVNAIDDQRAIAKDDYNRRKFNKDLSAIKIKEIRAQLNQAKTTKERLTIKAPIDGKILEVNIRPGEFASAGALTQPLIRLGDVSTLHVRVEFDEENASRIGSNSIAQGFKRDATTTAIPLKFLRVEPYVKPKQNLAISGQRVDTRVIQVIYVLPPQSSTFFVGQQLDVFIKESK